MSLLREKITNGEGWTGLLETGAWSGLCMRQGWSSFVYVTPWIISSLVTDYGSTIINEDYVEDKSLFQV